MMAREWLEVTRGPAAGARLEVALELTVGRAHPGGAGLAGDQELSRTHARFWRAAGGQLLVEDLGSANGTFVGGGRIDRPAVLMLGDEVQVGATTLVVRGEERIPPGPPTVQPTRVRGQPVPSPVPSSPAPSASEPAGSPPPPPMAAPAGPEHGSQRRLRALSILVLLLILAVAGLGVALATRGGTASNDPVVRNSTVVNPIFPVNNLKFSGQVAIVKPSSAGSAIAVTIDWGDGTAPTSGVLGREVADGRGSFTRSVSGTHKYTRVATFSVTVTVTSSGATVDRASNLAVVTNCFCVSKLPKVGQSVDLGPVSGQVLVRLPSSATFQPLVAPRAVPDGSQLDVSHGSVVVQAPPLVSGNLQAGLFDGGVFQILQSQALGRLVELKVQSASTAGCASGISSRTLGLLHSNVNGTFETQGRYAAATVRGTEWTTSDQCNGTLTRVQRGVVDVKDLRTGHTVSISAGQSYLAPR
jgi:FHA domain